MALGMIILDGLVICVVKSRDRLEFIRERCPDVEHDVIISPDDFGIYWYDTPRERYNGPFESTMEAFDDWHSRYQGEP